MTTPIPAHTAMTRPSPESQQPHPPSQAAADEIDTLDAKVDEINLKLTALIAALNMTAEVDAALTGEITTNSSDASSHE